MASVPGSGGGPGTVDEARSAAANTHEVDPQYLYILPTFFTVTEELMRIAELKTYKPERIYACILRSLANPAKYPEHLRTRISDAQGVLGTPGVSKDVNNALAWFGLSFHQDSFNEISRVYNQACHLKIPILATHFLVEDEAKARKYVDLGVKVDPSTMMFSTPSSLAAAAQDHEKVLQLVQPYGWDRTITRCSHKVTTKIGGGLTFDRVCTWIEDRVAFREQVLEKYRKLVWTLALGDEVGERFTESSTRC
ncbi:unnamed protein product [Periconia digitata]|uniref:Uncharacterized protein n=1 Tax=Periconia digitata TaxID=1303443 RepID=A0A9W4XYX6_9PLEO|nr:unnamed protein product [Periconia digitata]